MIGSGQHDEVQRMAFSREKDKKKESSLKEKHGKGVQRWTTCARTRWSGKGGTGRKKMFRRRVRGNQ